MRSEMPPNCPHGRMSRLLFHHIRMLGGTAAGRRSFWRAGYQYRPCGQSGGCGNRRERDRERSGCRRGRDRAGDALYDRRPSVRPIPCARSKQSGLRRQTNHLSVILGRCSAGRHPLAPRLLCFVADYIPPLFWSCPGFLSLCLSVCRGA
jgi:hypothetical protein